MANNVSVERIKYDGQDFHWLVCHIHDVDYFIAF
jgi:hypothetical protein